MRWNETIASKCRWSEYAEELFYDWDVFAEDSSDDYQGHATIIAFKEGKFAYLYWSYGSCSGCDGYEDMTDEERRAEFKNMAEIFDSHESFEKWTNMQSQEWMREALFNYRAAFEQKFIEEFESYKVN